MRKLKMHGKKFSDVEITNISTHGIWILVDNKEYFLSYKDFPWFKEVPISKILKVEQPYPGHLYWPEIDVDLSIDIIEYPERFILKAKNINT